MPKAPHAVARSLAYGVLLGVAALWLSVGPPLAAQEATPSSTREALNPMTGLMLSSEQQRQLQSIEAEFATRFQAFAATHNAAIKAAKRAPTRAELDSARALLVERRARVRAVLTLEQRTQYDANARRIQATTDSLRALRGLTSQGGAQ